MLNRLRSSWHFARALAGLRTGNIADARQHFDRYTVSRPPSVQHDLLHARILINERKSDEAKEIIEGAFAKLRKSDCGYGSQDSKYLRLYAQYYLSLIDRRDADDLRLAAKTLHVRRILTRTLPLPDEKIPVS
jgi:predicted Zn-dependent protease